MASKIEQVRDELMAVHESVAARSAGPCRTAATKLDEASKRLRAAQGESGASTKLEAVENALAQAAQECENAAAQAGQVTASIERYLGGIGLAAIGAASGPGRGNGDRNGPVSQLTRSIDDSDSLPPWRPRAPWPERVEAHADRRFALQVALEGALVAAAFTLGAFGMPIASLVVGVAAGPVAKWAKEAMDYDAAAPPRAMSREKP